MTEVYEKEQYAREWAPKVAAFVRGVAAALRECASSAVVVALLRACATYSLPGVLWADADTAQAAADALGASARASNVPLRDFVHSALPLFLQRVFVLVLV